MTFHLGFKETILFDSWRTTDVYGLLGSMIGVVLLGMIYEAIKNYREYLNVNNAIHYPSKLLSRKVMIFSSVHLLQTLLQVIQLVLGFFLMFIFMTYNGYLCIAVALGSMFGYFIFSWSNGRCDSCCS
ncbi:PREDICTED: high affinity copper uptake protein 1-like isoform X2 [Ceratosolen solmsi marchali]|nr:PREDICTED: high affinity copper uptake protein 1-like isoform X2 [Ceratosolen solmsi marchali]